VYNKSTKELISYINEVLSEKAPINQYIISSTIYIDGSNDLKGTYIHQLLLLHLLSGYLINLLLKYHK
jgi:hypothetical protein